MCVRVCGVPSFLTQSHCLHTKQKAQPQPQPQPHQPAGAAAAAEAATVVERDAALLHTAMATGTTSEVSFEFLRHVTNDFANPFTAPGRSAPAANLFIASVVVGGAPRQLFVKRVLDAGAKELGIALRLDHANIMPVTVYHRSAAHGVYIVTEAAERGTLADQLSDDASASALTWGHRVKIIADAVAGVTALHQHHLLHHDLKGANLVIRGETDHDNSGRAQLIDLGLAKDTAPDAADDAESTPGSGTRGYKCIEYAMGNCSYGPAQDVFGLGVVGLELFTGKVAARLENRDLWKTRAMQVPDTRLQAPPPFILELAKLARRCVAAEPEDRPPLSARCRRFSRSSCTATALSTSPMPAAPRRHPRSRCRLAAFA